MVDPRNGGPKSLCLVSSVLGVISDDNLTSDISTDRFEERLCTEWRKGE